MSLESAVRIGQLVPSNPSGADLARTADDHLRLLKTVLKGQLGDANDEPLTIKFSALNKILQALTPVGTIAAFGLALDQVPVGWALCDGREVDRSDGTAKITTPDLRGLALVGAIDGRPAGTRFGQASRTVTTEAAGAHTHAVTIDGAAGHKHNVSVADTVLTEAQMPAHSHGNGVNDPDAGFFPYGLKAAPGTSNDPASASHGTIRTQGVTETIGGGQAHGHAVSEDTAGAHTHTASTDSTGSHGHSVTVNLEQPSVSILYIMKV